MEVASPRRAKVMARPVARPPLTHMGLQLQRKHVLRARVVSAGALNVAVMGTLLRIVQLPRHELSCKCAFYVRLVLCHSDFARLMTRG